MQQPLSFCFCRTNLCKAVNGCKWILLQYATLFMHFPLRPLFSSHFLIYHNVFHRYLSLLIIRLRFLLSLSTIKALNVLFHTNIMIQYSTNQHYCRPVALNIRNNLALDNVSRVTLTLAQPRECVGAGRARTSVPITRHSASSPTSLTLVTTHHCARTLSSIAETSTYPSLALPTSGSLSYNSSSCCHLIMCRPPSNAR